MFSLLYGFWKLLFRKAEFHVLILGLDGAGKTVSAAAIQTPKRLAIFNISSCCVCAERARASEGHFRWHRGATAKQNSSNSRSQHWPPAHQSDADHVLGSWRAKQPALIVGKVSLSHAREIRVIWIQYAAAGRPLTRTRRVCHTPHRYYSEAHGLLYIVDSTDPARLDESRDVLRGLLHHPDLAGIPVLVFANKQDTPGAAVPHDVQSHFGLHQQMIDGTGSSQPQHVLGVTALNGDGVEEGIRWLVDAVRASPRALALSGGAGWTEQAPV